MIVIKALLRALAITFLVYLVARGAVWRGEPPQNPELTFLSMGITLSVALLCIFLPGRRLKRGQGQQLPLWFAIIAEILVFLAIVLCYLGAGAHGRGELMETWVIGVFGVFSIILLVRRQGLVAWAGMMLFVGLAVGYYGILTAISVGTLGSLLWLGTAQVVMVLTDNVTEQSLRWQEVQRESVLRVAQADARVRQRRALTQRALTVAEPTLVLLLAQDGRLDAEQKRQAVIAEATLRDELRGGRLLDSQLRESLVALRESGLVVLVHDEGFSESLCDDDLVSIRGRLTATLAEIPLDAGVNRVYIRGGVSPEPLVTVVALSGDAEERDEVSMWRELKPDAAR